MNLYNAIMKAADHIEANPGKFRFMTWEVPSACGSPGCALGWIGFFAGIKGDANTVAQAMGHKVKDELVVGNIHGGPRWFLSDPNRCDMPFYRQLEDLLPVVERRQWQKSPAICAKGLRLYAEKYHGHEKPRPTQALVADLMTKVMGERIPEEA